MFDLSNLILFITAGLMLNFTPGPDMLYCATRSLSQGRAAGLVSALGIAGGGLVHTALAAAGLSALLLYSRPAFMAVKYAGVIYLIYLGVQMIRSGNNPVTDSELPQVPLWRIFRQGIITNILNPKVALFFLSFLPQFVDPTRGSVAVQILVLGTIFNCTGTIVNGSVGILFGRVGGWLDQRPLFWKIQRWLAGSILIALGAALAVPEKR